ncbi:putative reverse transcriptase domain-containing protein [Tanacetum coccineum]
MNVTPSDSYSDGTLFGGVTDWYPEPRIPTTVPVTTPTIDPPVIHDDTLLIPTETPTISPITSTIPPTAPTTHYTSPFIHTDSSDNDTPDTPPTPTHEIPPIEYRYHPNGLVHIARKRVGPLPTHRLVVRHSVDYSSSDYFNSDDSSRDSPSDSSSETPSDSSSDALSDSSSGHSSSDHSSPALPSGMRSSHQLCPSVSSIPHSCDAIIERPSHSSSAGPSRKRSRSPTISVSISSPVPGALSSICTDLLPPHKRIRSSNSVMDLEDCMGESFESFVPRETSLKDEVVVRGSDEPYSEPDIDLEIQAMIDECIAYADAFRAEGIDSRVVVETVAREEVETSARGMVEVRVDRVTHPVVSDDDPAQKEGAIEVAHETLGDMSERISELERDNTRLRGMLDVARGNGNGNGNGNGGRNSYKNQNVNFGGFRPVARECTYQDFLKCQPLNFKGMEGVVGLTHWFKKMETVFHIRNYLQKNQVKYATCTLLDSALTWWNTHMRTIGIEAPYAMTWTELMKLMTEVRFQELVLLCTRMVPDEEDKVDRFIRGLPDNIQGNVIAAEPTRLQEAICIANNLMDQKLKGYVRSAENKISEKKRYGNKCKLHHRGPCTVRCGNCKGVGHMARDYTAAVAPNTQRAPVGNQSDRGNKIGNKTGNNKATAKAYAIRGGGANSDSNVVMGMLLLNNCYASMLFDSGADRSFVSSTFSALLDVAPSTLDTSYVVELADRRILETNIILKGCTLGLLGHPFDIDLIPIELGSFDVIIGMDWLAKYHAVIVCDEKIVMAISVISVSLDSLEESVGTSSRRVILFGNIPTTIPDTTPTVTLPATHIDTTVIPTEILIVSPIIPSSPDYTPASSDYSPASDTKFDLSEDPSSEHLPPLPATSPFLSLTDDSSDSRTPDIPPLPIHGTPFTKITLSTQRSPAATGALRR